MVFRQVCLKHRPNYGCTGNESLQLWHDDAYTNVTQDGIQLIHRMSIFDHQIANQLQSIYLKTCPWLNNTFITFSLQRKHSEVSHSINFHKDELCGLAEPILFSTD